jgi:hypothetical protein
MDSRALQPVCVSRPRVACAAAAQAMPLPRCTRRPRLLCAAAVSPLEAPLAAPATPLRPGVRRSRPSPPCAATTAAPPEAAEPDAPPTPASRDFCRRCGRAICLCHALPADGGAPTKLEFCIVQSRRERFNALSTGRLAQLGLANCSLVWDADNDEVLPQPALPPGAGVLFPGAGSKMLGPGDASPPALVVIDGTWSQAGRMLRKNAWLAALPRYEFATAPDQARARRLAGACAHVR